MWGDLFHTAKKSGRDERSSIKSPIYGALVVNETPTKERKMLKQKSWELYYVWIPERYTYSGIRINPSRNYPNGTVDLPLLLRNYLYCTINVMLHVHYVS
jgi:hypothetical protein